MSDLHSYAGTMGRVELIAALTFESRLNERLLNRIKYRSGRYMTRKTENSEWVRLLKEEIARLGKKGSVNHAS